MQQTQKIMPEAIQQQAFNQNSNSIIPEIMPKSQRMPSLLNEIMSVLEDLHPNVDYNCNLNILLAKTAQMVSFKRIAFKELEKSNPNLINHYAINFMPSGMGKDRICNDLDNYIFKNFGLYFKDKARNLIIELEKKINHEAETKFPSEKSKHRKEAYISSEKEKIRDLVIEINTATQEGLFADAETFNKAGFGSIFVKLSEFGTFLQNNRQDDIVFFNSLYEAYDGKILSKSTKHDKRKASIENMPVNILLYSDPFLFKAEIQSLFNQLLEMGFSRRSSISFQENNIIKLEKDGETARKIQEQAYIKAEEIAEKLISIFMKIPDNAVYQLDIKIYDSIFHDYKLRITEQFNSCNIVIRL